MSHPHPLTKSLAIATSLWTAGALSYLSLLSIPTLLAAPHNIAAKQFRLLSSSATTAVLQPAASLLAALLHGAVAYRLYASPYTTYSSSSLGGAWTRWAVSAALTAAILPWTLGVMDPVRDQLLVIAGTSEKREGGTAIAEKTEGLLRTWNGLNAVRGVLAAGAGALGLWSVFDTEA